MPYLQISTFPLQTWSVDMRGGIKVRKQCEPQAPKRDQGLPFGPHFTFCSLGSKRKPQVVCPKLKISGRITTAVGYKSPPCLRSWPQKNTSEKPSALPEFRSHLPSLRTFLGEFSEIDRRVRVLLLVLFPAGLHEEGVRGHLAPRLVGVSFTHGAGRRRPGGRGAVGGRPRGPASRPNTRPPPLARKATGAAAPPPARPAAACAHTPSSRRPPARLTRGHHVSPEAPERRRPPRPGLRQERRARRRGPFPDRNVFPASTSPARLKELSPRDRRSKKRLKPGPDAASRPPQPPALPGPPLRLRSPARTPRAAVPGPAKRLWGKGKRQAHEHEGAKRGSCLVAAFPQSPAERPEPAETLPSQGSGVNWFIANAILCLLFCRVLRATAT